HGGEVTVDSEEGFGTEFNVALPLEPLRQAAIPAAARLGEAPRRGRVLVVDDEEPVARIAQRALTAAGMEVTVALDGHTAVSHCHDRLFDAILLDLNMPRPDGTETLARLRAAAPRTPVMIVSGRLGAGEIAEAAGVEFLGKPYVYTDLVARVSALIEAHTLA
ncbi:MAG: response regulator, partial [Dehalococcoidia bacterium]